MRLRISRLVLVLLSVGLGVLPAQAQSESQIGSLVEALRQAAIQSGIQGQGLYSDWQVKAENIPRWSKSCTGKEITPQQFAASPATARGILVCVVRDVFRDEYRTSGNNTALAVRRTAAWWMTGDPNRYNSAETGPYTQKVLGLFQQSRPAATSTATAPATTTSTAPVQNQSTPYDRYMRAGYDATKQKNYPKALLYFRRALDERPNDTYATQAIRNVETYRGSNRPTGSPAPSSSPAPNSSSSSQSSPANSTAITQQQAVALVNQWLQAKPEIFAPPFNQQRAGDLTTGELYGALIKPGGVIAWLKNNQAYYRYGVQKVESVERFASSRDRATIEIKLTEDRTLYRRGIIDRNQTDFTIQQVRYSLEFDEGRWKVTDYKTVDGLLLERAVLTTTTTSDSR